MPVRYEGTVRGQGQSYADGREIQYIAISKAAADDFPYREGERVPVELHLADQVFTAGIRTTPAQPIVYISSDLLNAEGEEVSLASVLESIDLGKGQRVTIEVDGACLRVTPNRSQPTTGSAAP